VIAKERFNCCVRIWGLTKLNEREPRRAGFYTRSGKTNNKKRAGMETCPTFFANLVVRFSSALIALNSPPTPPE
jgi:hypothetical protein